MPHFTTCKSSTNNCGGDRLTNMKGSASGRCMKTCPYNREDIGESTRQTSNGEIIGNAAFHIFFVDISHALWITRTD
jgi:hypothetical protein